MAVFDDFDFDEFDFDEKPCTERENLIRVLNHQEALWIPNTMMAECIVGTFDEIEKGSFTGNGIDGFGVEWVKYIPKPGKFILDDITRWKKDVTFPDVNSIDWKKKYETELPSIDKEEKYFVYASANGPFERLVSLMGFEGGLMAMFEEPEATRDFMEAVVDYKLQMAEKVMQNYKITPDAWLNYDDVASARCPFMSKKMFEEIIMPPTKRYYDSIRNMGLEVINHVCGCWELFIEDYIDMGCIMISSVQPSNDIAGIIQKYGDKVTIEGGFDSSKTSWAHASDEMIRKEVDRCMDEYGSLGRGFVFMPSAFANLEDISDPNNFRVMGLVSEEYTQYGKKYNKY